MYARLNLNSGCTLQQLRDDLVGLLTGTVTTAAGLVSANTGTSEVIRTVTAEWTFVQHITDTSTRVHFVLSGVDDGGVAKTLGIVMTDTSGSLGFMSWNCGAWDSVNRRPAAIDVTGWTLATAWFSEADFAAGSVKNGIVSHSSNAAPVSVGAFTTGLMQIQVASEAGITGIYSHLSATHQTLVEIADIPRAYSPELGVLAWPFLAVNVYSFQFNATPLNAAAGPSLLGLATTASLCGLGYGPSNWTSMPSPLSTELAAGIRYWGAGTAGAGTAMLDFIRDTGEIAWFTRKDGAQQYYPRPSQIVPRTSTRFILNTMPIKHRIPGKIYALGTNSLSNIAYLDEIVIGADTYVAVGNGHTCIYKG